MSGETSVAAPDSAANSSTRRYEPGIDGLRAVSIVAVLVFHADVTLLGGGFLGVSVFFTVSGFLITGLLLRELTSTGGVDLRRFWVRRIKRLTPAAIVVVAVVVLLTRTRLTGWGWPQGFDWPDAIAALTSSTNWHLVHLAPDTGFRLVHPLTPYWSLAVEEQFYIGISLLFLAVRRGRRPVVTIAVALSVVWIASSLLGVVLDGTDRRQEFGTDVRAAELAAGALLAVLLHARPGALVPVRRIVDVLGWLALATVSALFVLATLDQTWLRRGGFALMSIPNVLLVTGVLAHGSLDRVLGRRPFVALGTISYSLYLVHWPIFLAMSPERVHLRGGWLIVVKFLVAVVVGSVLHRLVERPLRRTERFSAKTVVAGWLGATAAVAAISLALLA